MILNRSITPASSPTTAALRLLLEAKPKPEWVSYNLCHKMDMEDPAGVKLFVKHGADVNVLLMQGMFKGSRPLHFAIYRRRGLKVIRILLQGWREPESCRQHRSHAVSACSQTRLEQDRTAIEIQMRPSMISTLARNCSPRSPAEIERWSVRF